MGRKSGFGSLVLSFLIEKDVRNTEEWVAFPPPANYHAWCVSNAVQDAFVTLGVGSFVHGLQFTLS